MPVSVQLDKNLTNEIKTFIREEIARQLTGSSSMNSEPNFYPLAANPFTSKTNFNPLPPTMNEIQIENNIYAKKTALFSDSMLNALLILEKIKNRLKVNLN